MSFDSKGCLSLISFVFRVVYTGYSITLRAFAALRCLRTQPFHDAQPLQVEKKLSLPLHAIAWALKKWHVMFLPNHRPVASTDLALTWDARISRVLLQYRKRTLLIYSNGKQLDTQCGLERSKRSIRNRV
jgi:hypothetical protein